MSSPSSTSMGFVLTTGVAWGWGQNTSGQLGIQTLTAVSSPVAMVGNHSFVQVFQGNIHTIGLKGDGSVWATGGNSFGQLGNRSTTNTSSPVLVVGNHSFIAITAGGYTSVGLKADGSVWTWGEGTYGELGNGSFNVSTSSPVLVVGSHSFVQITAGLEYVMGLKIDGSVWTWGGNVYGELGNQTTTSSTSPVLVVGNHSFVAIAAGGYVSMGLKSDGSCWCWGDNTSGSLGNNSTTAASSPVLVVGNHSFISISSGGSTSSTYQNQAGLKADGSVWCWGSSRYGSIGNGQGGVSYSSPVAVIGNHSFNIIMTGPAYMGAMKNDGSIWMWGAGSSGRLGQNVNVNSTSSPVLVVGSLHFADGWDFRQHKAYIDDSANWHPVSYAYVNVNGSTWNYVTDIDVNVSSTTWKKAT